MNAAHYTKILVPLDGSTVAAQVLPHVLALARAFDAEVTLLRVAPDTSDLSQVLEESRNFVHIADREQQLLDEALAALAVEATELNRLGVSTQTVALVGKPAQTIVNYAAAHDFDLIVMCTHGRTGLARWVYGSVAAKVMQAAPCALFVVRANLDKD